MAQYFSQTFLKPGRNILHYSVCACAAKASLALGWDTCQVNKADNPDILELDWVKVCRGEFREYGAVPVKQRNNQLLLNQLSFDGGIKYELYRRIFGWFLLW